MAHYLQFFYIILCGNTNKKVITEYSIVDRKSPLKPQTLVIFRICGIIAYKQVSPATFLYDLSKISMKVEKCGKNDLLCIFSMHR